ncbi:MAG: helix-turn-helix domain-containing protein [Clostridiaceae bacterium]|nr:helix-turn-helix domain-containing protein [Clostridiaceae bacterium]
MINKIFAQNFVRKIEQTMNLKVNVMDEHGIIVASTSKERVGDFHLAAYEIIQKGLPMLVTHEPTKELIGVNMPGVNLRLTSSNETIGVIGVSGNPDEVTELAKLVKLTFETMYEYEYKKNLAVKGKSGIWNFAHALLNETPLNEYSIKKIAAKLGYQDQYPHLPVYIHLHSEYRGTVIQHFLDSASTLSCYQHPDIILPVDKGIFYLKACKKQASSSYFLDRELISQFLDKLENEFFSRERIEDQSLTYHVLVAPVQTEFVMYQRIYHNLLWVSQNKRDCLTEPINYLADWLPELMASQIPVEFMEPLFSWYSTRIRENMEPEYFMETVKWLLASDMKLDVAAKHLHLHKNSVIARLKKIKEILNINPIASPHDMALLQYLYLYMEGH